MRWRDKAPGSDSRTQLAWLILRVIGKLSFCTKTSLVAYVSGDYAPSNSPTGDIIFNAVLRLEGLGFVRVAQEQIAITDEGRRFLDKLPFEALAGCTSCIAYLSALVPASLAAHIRRPNQFCQTYLARARAVAQRCLQMSGSRPWKPKVAMLGYRATTLVHMLRRDAKVWRALGLSGMRSDESSPDVFGPPLIPPGQSVIAQLDATKIMPLLSAAWNAVIRRQFKLTELARQHARSIELYLRDACPRWSSQFNLGGFPRFMQRRGALTGVLIVAIFLGSIDVAMRTFAIGTEPHIDKATSAKIQDRQIAVVEPDTAKVIQTSDTPDASQPLQTSKPAGSKTEISVPEVEAFSVSRIHSTEEFVTASATHPASATQQEAVSLTPASQSRTAAEPHLVPLPTRKPKRPIAKTVGSSTAELKRIGPRQGEREPKPIAFGSIGYNYDPQR
jgi:hypothetical protein